jgi:hypothetical protein
MSQSEKSFTVSDRRHFTVDGRPREEPESSVASQAPETRPASESRAEPRRTTAPPGDEGKGSPADLGQFLLSLGAQAGMLLAGPGLPEGAEPAEALEGARSIISILEMLRDKTEGRRTPSEDAILGELLFDLRMRYVEKTRTRKP